MTTHPLLLAHNLTAACLKVKCIAYVQVGTQDWRRALAGAPKPCSQRAALQLDPSQMSQPLHGMSPDLLSSLAELLNYLHRCSVPMSPVLQRLAASSQQLMSYRLQQQEGWERRPVQPAAGGEGALCDAEADRLVPVRELALEAFWSDLAEALHAGSTAEGAAASAPVPAGGMHPQAKFDGPI